MEKNNKKLLYYFSVLIFIIIGVYLYFLSRRNYLLFHIIAEFYSIVIAIGIFIVSWNTRKNSQNNGLSVLGIAYLFVGIIDFYHTISYFGMNIFKDYKFYANQLWIIARFLEAIAILFFAIFENRINKKYNPIIFFIFTSYILIGFLSVLEWRIFPICFVEGVGQTQFKLISEYIICFILFVSAVLLYFKRHKYDKNLFLLLWFSIIITIFSEICFTLYIDNYGISNVIGHLFKILSFYLIYRAVIVNMLTRPFDIIFNKLKENQNFLKNILDIAEVIILLIDKNKNVAMINKKGVELLGCKEENEIVGKNWFDNFIPESKRNKLNYIFDLILSEKAEFEKNIENPILSKNNTEKIIRWSNIVLKDKYGKIYGVLSSGYDITDYKKYEESLEEINKTKERILRIVAHDIRNYIFSIRGYIEILDKKILKLKEYIRDDNLLKDINHSFMKIKNNVEQSHIFLDNLLSWSLLQTQGLQYISENIKIYYLIEQIINIYKNLIDDKKIEIDISIDKKLEIYNDKNVLQILLQNIILNAVKYSKINGKIRICNETDKDENIIIKIIDNGIGMSENQLRKIFDMTSSFSTVGTKGEKGSGLGLILCKELINKINGNIEIQSKINEGTTVIIILPFFNKKL